LVGEYEHSHANDCGCSGVGAEVIDTLIASSWWTVPVQRESTLHRITRFTRNAQLLVSFGSSEAFVDLVPVDGVPPGGEVVWPLVLVLEGVSVFPAVVAEVGV